MTTEKRILIAAGGSGGHMFPAIAVAQALSSRGAKVLFVGAGRQMEKRNLVGEYGFESRAIPFAPITGKGLSGLVKAICMFPRALAEAFKLFREYRPDVVIGFGGYPCVVPVLVSWLKGVPAYLQEQNVKIGAANKFISLFVNKIFAVHGASGFWGSCFVEHINNPVRESFNTIRRYQAPRSSDPKNILVLGGSQGASAVNTAIIELLPFLKEMNAKILHQAGESEAERVQSEYERAGMIGSQVVGFMSDMIGAYSTAHLVIARAGAMTVAEVTASGIPAIYIPLPIAGNHQKYNAMHLAEEGAAVIIEQQGEWKNILKETLAKLFTDSNTFENIAAAVQKVKDSNNGNSANLIADTLLKS